MKYIRTKGGIHKCRDGFENWEKGHDEIKSADTIEELCDEFVYVNKGIHHFLVSDDLDKAKSKQYKTYGAIWTDKGLIYVAKMNEKGELELL